MTTREARAAMKILAADEASEDKRHRAVLARFHKRNQGIQAECPHTEIISCPECDPTDTCAICFKDLD